MRLSRNSPFFSAFFLLFRGVPHEFGGERERYVDFLTLEAEPFSGHWESGLALEAVIRFESGIGAGAGSRFSIFGTPSA